MSKTNNTTVKHNYYLLVIYRMKTTELTSKVTQLLTGTT